MEGGAREVRDRGLERVEAVVERQERVLAEGYDGRFFLRGERRRAGLLRPHRRVVSERALLPLRDGLAVDAVTRGELGHALFAPLDGAADGLRRAGAAVEYLSHRRWGWMGIESRPRHPGTKHQD